MTESPDYSSTSHRAGLGLVGAFGVLSAVSTFILLSYFLYCCLTSLLRKLDSRALESTSPSQRHRNQVAASEGICEFLNSTLGRYLVYLFICDHIQGIGFAINFIWAQKGVIEEGSACTTQGAFDQIGNIGAAFWSLLIGFQTFCLLFLQIRPHRFIEYCATGVVWSAVIILPLLGPYVIQEADKGLFWSRSGLWCWIGDAYKDLRLVYLYAWIFLNLASCLCMYSLIYLKFAGIIEYHRGVPLRRAFRWNGPQPKRNSILKQSPFQPGSGAAVPQPINGVGKDLVKIAQRLMWYPLVYAIVIIPVAVCRMGVLAGWNPPFWFYVFAGICYTCSGLSNTLLFLFTRHLFIQRRAKNKVMRPATGRHIEITVDVMHTSDHPLTPLPPDPKGSWGYGSDTGKDLRSLEAQAPDSVVAMADLELGKKGGQGDHHDSDADDSSSGSRRPSQDGYESWLGQQTLVRDPSKPGPRFPPRVRNR